MKKMMSLAGRAGTTKAGNGSLAAARRRGLSTLSQVNRSVLSRRVWQAHTKKHPKSPKVEKVKAEIKPWPRNVQIAGGVAASFFIPYTVVWIITSSPTLRQVFGPFLPLDRLRKHFGELEWDSQSYVDQEDEIPEGFYQFPEEASFLDRQQQAKIEELDNETIAATIYFLGDEQLKETKHVLASVKANPRSLAQLVGGSVPTACATRVAVDFVDDDFKDEMNGATSNLDIVPLEHTPTWDLLKRMSVYSTWHYAPGLGTDQEQGNNKKSSDAEIGILKLEYTVEKLEKDLRDPTCTRDRDEMQAELRQAKRDLSRLRWKRRLGLQ